MNSLPPPAGDRPQLPSFPPDNTSGAASELRRSPPPAPHPQHALAVGAIVLLTLLWGTTFLVVKQTVVDLNPSWLNFIRFSLAALCVLPYLRWQGPVWRAGAELGLWLTVGYATQTIGLQYTSVGRSAFITALYVVFVPVLMGWSGQPVTRRLSLAAGLAIVGVGCLCWDGSGPNPGDLWTVLTAIGWSGYIWRLEAYSQQLPLLPLAAAQLWVTAGFSGLWVVLSPGPQPVLTAQHWPSLLFLGILATGLTVILQTWAQRRVPAGQAAILFTLEPVWASAFAAWLFQERLGLLGALGCVSILAAALLSQLSPSQGDRDAL